MMRIECIESQSGLWLLQWEKSDNCSAITLALSFDLGFQPVHVHVHVFVLIAY